MIEIKYEIVYLVIVGFLLERIHPIFKIDNIDPNLVAALRVNFLGLSLLPLPIVHSHPSTVGGRGVGEGVGEIPAASFTAGVAEGTGVSSPAICASGKRRTNPKKPIKNNKQRLRRSCFITTFDQLASVILTTS